MTTLIASLVISSTIWIAPLQGYNNLDHYTLGIYEIVPGEVIIQGAAVDVSSGNKAYLWTAQYSNQQVTAPAFEFESQLLPPAALDISVPVSGVDVAIRGYLEVEGGTLYIGDRVLNYQDTRESFVYFTPVPEPSYRMLFTIALIFFVVFILRRRQP